MDNLLDGRAISAEINAQTHRTICQIKQEGILPRLVFIRLGNDPASVLYVGMKSRTARHLGIDSETIILKKDTDQSELLSLLYDLNHDQNVHGILVQSPLPNHIDENVISRSILPSKDVDGFHPENVGKLLLGAKDGFIPCTPAGIHEMLRRSDISLPGSHAVILGRGNIVGKPMAALLLQKAPDANCTVTICHSQTRHLAEITRSADILISALGVAEFVQPEMIKKGTIVIDVGVSRVADSEKRSKMKFVGDVAFSAVQPLAKKITPNPGGVGPMTIAMLMKNVSQAASQDIHLSKS